MKNILTRVAVAILLAVLWTGCAGLDLVVLRSGGGGGGAAPNSVPNVGNNEVVTLSAATYSGNVRIDGNNATLEGQGIELTTVRGDVVIDGNSVTVRRLTISGDVTIDANNADLRGARIRGRVHNNGNNNRF